MTDRAFSSRRLEMALALDDEGLMRLADSMRRLTQYPEWADYCALLRSNRVSARERGIDDDPSELLKWRGVVLGLQEAETAPHEVLRQATETAARLAKEREARADGATVLPFTRASMFEGGDAGPTF